MQYKIVCKNATFSIQVVTKLPRNNYENGIKDNDMLKYRLQREDYLHCVKIVQIRIFFWSVFSPNTRKYGPEKNPYVDTFHAVLMKILCIV